MIVLMNQVLSQTNVLSGGEKITVEFLRRWKNFREIVLIMPENGVPRIRAGEGLDVHYDPLPLMFMDRSSLYWKHIFLVPLAWAIHAVNCWKKIAALTINDGKMYSSGDFFCNTVPAFLKKSRDPRITWIVSIFHIIDSPLKRKGGHSFISNLISMLLQRFSFSLIRKKADVIFVLNDELRSSLLALGFPSGKMFVVGAGIDFRQIDRVAAEGCGYDACFMARLSATKGLFDLPRIWAGVVQQYPAAKLLIIGEGLPKDVDSLKKSFADAGLSGQITMVGAKSGEEKYRLMKSAKLFIFPSYEEGFAISILEAMACKTPVIAWNLPAYSAIYGERILVSAKGDVGNFSRQAGDLLGNEQKRLARAQAGYAFAQSYDWDAVAQKAAEIITKTDN
jgi:glycosyltransferase involved in cell wall biosynthesis